MEELLLSVFLSICMSRVHVSVQVQTSLMDGRAVCECPTGMESVEQMKVFSVENLTSLGYYPNCDM